MGGGAETGRVREVHCWWLRAREEPSEAVLGVLDDADRAVVAGSGDDEQRASAAWRIAVTKLVVGRLLDVEPNEVMLTQSCSVCGGTDHGRFRIAAASGVPTLSISAAADENAVVVAVGIDVEVGVHVASRQDLDAAHQRACAVLTSEDVARLNELDESERGDAALAALAQVEAYGRARGTGCVHLDPELVVSLDPARPSVSSGTTEWYARRIDPGPAYVAVLVGDRRPRAVRSHDATELLIDLAHRTARVDAGSATA